MAQTSKKPATGPKKTKTAAKKASINVNEKYCSTCAAVIHKDAEICPKCGVRQHVAQTQAQSSAGNKIVKNKTTAGILALLLGGIGVHKFYLGRVGIGIVYLLFAWTLIPAFIAFIEGLIYLTFSGTDAEFTAKYTQ